MVDFPTLESKNAVLLALPITQVFKTVVNVVLSSKMAGTWPVLVLENCRLPPAKTLDPLTVTTFERAAIVASL